VSDRDRALQELGLADGLAWQLVGLIDDVPVIKTRVLQGRAVLLDVARFAQVQLTGSDGSASGEPLLNLAEPDEAEVRARFDRGGTASSGAGQLTGANEKDTQTALEDRIRDEMLKVTIHLRLPGKISVLDKTAAFILAWE
jgi:hypothetical protein